MVTDLDLILSTLRLLDEPRNSSVGEVPDGTGGVTLDTDEVIRYYVNEGQYEVARTCAFIDGLAGVTSLPVGSRALRLHDLPPLGDHGPLWAVSAALWGTAQLSSVEQGRLAGMMGGFQFAGNGVTRYFFQEGDALGLNPPPNSAKPFKAAGPALPPVIVAGGNTAWLPDDQARLLYPMYAACAICRKRENDPLLLPRIGQLSLDYDALRLRMWQGLSDYARKIFYPVPPVPLAPPKGKAGGNGS